MQKCEKCGGEVLIDGKAPTRITSSISYSEPPPPGRDELAMAAMMGWLSSTSSDLPPAEVICQEVARFAYQMADAMLFERTVEKVK